MDAVRRLKIALLAAATAAAAAGVGWHLPRFAMAQPSPHGPPLQLGTPAAGPAAPPRHLRLIALAMHGSGAPLPPFAELWPAEGSMTSNDGYGAWASWEPHAYRLKYPGRPPLARKRRSSAEEPARLSLTCRADGRPEGLSGPEPVRAELVLPLHPDEPDVPRRGDPRYWLLAFTGGEPRRTAVSVRVGSGEAFSSELVRKRSDWSLPRPSPTVRLDPAEALRALSSGVGATVIAEGPGTWLDLRFEPDPDMARAAELMALHCEE